MANFENGSVKISNDIIDKLIIEIALRVEGVEEVLGYKNNTITDKIKTKIEDKNLKTQLTITVKEGYKIIDIAENIQKEIKKQIRTMLGLEVTDVDIVVKDIVNK